VQVEPVKINEIKLNVATSTLTSLELSWPELANHEEKGGS